VARLRAGSSVLAFRRRISVKNLPSNALKLQAQKNCGEGPDRGKTLPGAKQTAEKDPNPGEEQE
jgi:hypothetical protein